MKISIALCTYNGARFIRDQLESFVAQKRRPDEIVICDDASNDDTLALVQQWAATAPFPVHVHVNPECLGSTRNFQKAIELCTGDLIALSDQDDVWLDHKLAEAESAFCEQPSLGLWFTDAVRVDERLNPLNGTLWQSIGFSQGKQRKARSRDRLPLFLRRSFVTGGTMVFSARYRDQLLPIPHDLHLFIHDRWIATLLAAIAPVAFSPRPSMLYRQHSAQQIGVQTRSALAYTSRRFPRNHEHYINDLEIARAIDLRLEERSPFSSSAESRRILQERIELLTMRVNFPPSRFRRIRGVAGSVTSGAYSRHAEGLASAIKDLLL